MPVRGMDVGGVPRPLSVTFPEAVVAGRRRFRRKWPGEGLIQQELIDHLHKRGGADPFGPGGEPMYMPGALARTGSSRFKGPLESARRRVGVAVLEGSVMVRCSAAGAAVGGNGPSASGAMARSCGQAPSARFI